MFDQFFMDIRGFETWIVALHLSLLFTGAHFRILREPVLGAAEHRGPHSYQAGGQSPGRSITMRCSDHVGGLVLYAWKNAMGRF
jgi:hypothetical protein